MKTLEWLIKVNNWYEISCYEYLTEEFIEKHFDKLDWYCISMYQKLSESFIEKHSDKLSLDDILVFQTLSEAFIEKHLDIVYWDLVLQYQKLSKEIVYWDLVLQYQKLSKEFILKHKDKLGENYLSHSIESFKYSNPKYRNRYNQCTRCLSKYIELRNLSCNEAIMDRVLK